MLDKETRKEIKSLKRAKQFEEIYERFGSKAYVKNSPRLYMRRLIKELIKQGKYEEIKTKFGKSKYKAYYPLISRDKVYKKTNSKLLAFGAYLRGKIFRFIPYIMSGALMATGATYGVNREMYHESRVENQELIEEYNQDLERYAEEIRALNLSQTEIIVKVMSDIYEQYKYKFPKKEIFGYGRLSLYEDGYGVCRNISDDFCAKLNAIDPSFNAHNIVCQINSVDGNGEAIQYDLMDNIERRIEVIDEDDILTNSTNMDPNFIGNHMVAVINMEGETVPIVVDPTNPGMGAIYNGRIYMFNAPENALSTRPISTFIITETPFSIVSDYFDSLESRRSFVKLQAKYGPTSLEQTLERVRKKEEQQIIIEEHQTDERRTNKTTIKNNVPIQRRVNDEEELER